MTLDSRISLQKLEVFCLVVEMDGVGRAADHLYVSQPVVSAHLRTLQERLGAPIFCRDGRRMRLTEAGEAAYAWAKEVLTRSEEMAREIDGLAVGSTGGAVITSSMTIGSYLLPPILSRFRRVHQHARLTLHVTDPEAAVQQTLTGMADFALIATDDPPAASSLHVTEIATAELALVAGLEDGQVGDTVNREELEGLRYVCSPSGLLRRGLVERSMRRIGVQRRNIVIELGHPEAMKRAVRDCLGVGVLFRASVAEELAGGTLRAVEMVGVNLSIPVLLVRRAGKRFSPLQVLLADEIRETLNEVPAPMAT